MNYELKKRPWLLRLPSLSFRERAYYRFYAQRAQEFKGLYQNAALAFLPDVRLHLVPTDFSHRWIALCGFYELALTRMIASFAKRGGVLVDVGANFGYYSCLWAGLHPANQVIAFEASMLCLPYLQYNITQNHFGSRVEIKGMALGKEKGSALFDLGPNEQTGWGGFAASVNERQSTVEVARLDDIFQDTLRNETIDVLKIDVEGADTWVLLGATKLLKDKKIKHIFFEENMLRMQALNITKYEAIELLTSYGYKARYLTTTIVYAHC